MKGNACKQYLRTLVCMLALSFSTWAVAAAQKPVIVTLKTQYPIISEGKLPSAFAKGQQRRLIAQSQRVFIQSLQRDNFNIKKQYRLIPAIALSTDQAGLRELAASPLVESIEEDEVLHPTLAESVPLIGVGNITNRRYDGRGQTIVVMDTGVESSHPFLQNRVVWEICYSSALAQSFTAFSLCPNGNDEMHGIGAALPDFCLNYASCHHGTHVAGIAAGANNEYTGVAKNANIIAIQVFTKVESEELCRFGNVCIVSFTSDHLAALEEVIELADEYNIAALNISMGSGKHKTVCDEKFPTYSALVQTLKEKGVATVVTSGNDMASNATNFPGCLSAAITVGSTTKDDDVSWFSNVADWVDIMAPGSRITSSITGEDYAVMSGTSMAAPHVSGAIAVMRSAKPDATVDEMLHAMQKTGVVVIDPLTNKPRKRLQLDAALEELLNPTEDLEEAELDTDQEQSLQNAQASTD